MPNNLKTIVLTWNDLRPGHPAGVLAALWSAEGGDAMLNSALEYAAQETRKTGVKHCVHTFATNDADWRSKAIAAHARGGV